MDSFNIDNNTMNKIKNLVDSGDLSGAISQISPEMLSQFSNMMSKNSNEQNSNSEKNSSQNNNFNNNSSSNNNSNGFDFSNIDMNTILKMKSVMEKMNNTNDPRSNLLHSLKPYLRESRKEKLDQYVNLLNISKIADVLKTDKKENDKNG